jgi:hypothetical protein
MAQQFISPDVMTKIPKKFNVVSKQIQTGGFRNPSYQTVQEPDVQGLTPIQEMGTWAGRPSGQMVTTGYKMPVELPNASANDAGNHPMPKFYATYDAQGNFLKIQSENPYQINDDVVIHPEINANGELVNANPSSAHQNEGGFGSFVGGALKDFGPMLLAGLGANLFTGANLLGEAAGGIGGATAGDIAANNALAQANLTGYGSMAAPAAIASPVAAQTALTGTPLADIGALPAATPAITPAALTPLANVGAAETATAPDIAGAMSAGQTPYGTAPDITASTVGQMPSPDAITAIKNMLPDSLQSLLPTTPTGWAALMSGGGNVLSGLIGGNAAKTAAQIQADAAKTASANTMSMFNTLNAQGAPYRAQGYNALNQIGQLGSGTYGIYDAQGNQTGTGTGTGYLTQQFGPEQFAAGMDPGYAFRLQQGQMANQRASNLAGGLIGGNALKGMQDYTQGMASQEYGNAFNRFQTQRGNIFNTLAGIAGIGQSAQGQANQMGQNAVTAQGQLGVGSAAAQAAGQIGQANAYGGAATGAGNAYLLSQLLKQNQGVAAPQG